MGLMGGGAIGMKMRGGGGCNGGGTRLKIYQKV